MTSNRKAKCNEIYELIRSTLASHKIFINKSEHLALVSAYCELKNITPPIHFTPNSLKELISPSSPVTIKKKRVESKPKARQAHLVTSDMSKQQVAEVYQADLINFATKQERKIKSLLRKLNVEFEFQKLWIETKGKEFYISDFILPSLSSSLEIDGSSHNLKAQKDKDARKESYLLSLGIKTIRITNKQVNKIDAAGLHKILVKNA